MADRYLHFTGTAPGRFLTKRLRLPQPAELRRWSIEHPFLEGDLLHLTAADPLPGLADVLSRMGPGLRPTETVRESSRPAAVVVDATGVATAAALAEVHAALHPVVRSVADCGRVVVIGAPLAADDHH
ncbi:short chain dehydrogenase, partial [Streptomyces beijiangensis]|nr:short chain dehydrogenase [Streptomyces beijiangensis]